MFRWLSQSGWLPRSGRAPWCGEGAAQLSRAAESLWRAGAATAGAAAEAGEAHRWHSCVGLMVRPRRLGHVLRVAELAAALARAVGADAARAYLAGVVHDVARDLPPEEHLRLAPPECELDERHPLALHGRSGRALLERWGMTDEVVLRAVEEHTTGPVSGCRVSQVVYIADISEPGRGVNGDVRDLAFRDLDAAVRRAVQTKVTYLAGKGLPVHPRTRRLFEVLGCGDAARGPEAPWP